MPDKTAGPFSLPGVDFETWLLRFDKRGACTSPETRKALLARLQAAPDAPVILFSHGWNNEFGDATGLYLAFLTQLDSHMRPHPQKGQRPIFVGIIWPSTSLSWDRGPQIAAAPSDDVVAAEQAIKEELAEALPNQATRERFYQLLESSALTEEEGAQLASLVSASLGATIGKGGQEGAEAEAPGPEAVLTGLKALQDTVREQPAEDELKEGGTIDGLAPAAPQDAGALRFLDPRAVIRLASVYQMKDRAGTVGWNGVARLVEDILAHSKAPLHAVGHSYGGKVILSAIAGALVLRNVETVLLLQPAVSHLSFAAEVPGRQGSGGYHGVPAKVQRAILTTYSAYDFPLHEVFHRALKRDADLGELRVAGGNTSAGAPPNAYAALGGYGPRGSGEQLREPLPAPGDALAIPNGPAIIGLDGTIEHRVNGHGDVATPSAAWLLYLQMAG